MTQSVEVSVRMVVAQLCARVPGGTARYTAELLHALAASTPQRGRLDAVAARRCHALADLPVRVRTFGLADPVLSRLWERGLPPWPARGGVVHAPTLLVPPRSRRYRLVVTVHDVVPWTHPQTLTGRGVAFHRRMGARSARNADLIVTPSRAMADQVRRVLNPRCPVETYAPGCSALTTSADPEQDRLALGVGGPYVLFVGTAEPRKGLDLLVRAMARPDCAGLHLVVVGPPGWGDVRVDELARAARVADRVTVTGRITDEQLAALYAGARALTMPSLAEGFGLPVLEAMCAGVPVVTSDDAALVEVGGDATLVTPVGDVDALAVAIGQAVHDDRCRADLINRGQHRSNMYQWSDTAAALWRRYTELSH